MKKKIILIFLLGLLSLNVKAQEKNIYRLNVDTTNLLKPEVFNLNCLEGVDYSYFIYNSYIGTPVLIDDDDSINIVAYAQPMYTDTITALKSIVYLGHIRMISLMNMYSQFNGYYPDSNYTYFQIWDSTLTNLIYQINYDSVYKNAVQTNSSSYPSGAIYLREIIFDSSIVVKGKFYIALTFDPKYRLGFLDDKCFPGGIDVFSTYKSVCEDYDKKYPHEMIKLEGDSDWIYPEDIDTTNFATEFKELRLDYLRSIRTLLVFPKIDTAFDWATWNAQNSALNEIQEREKQINVFPNPAKDKITIESATELESIEIKNILGIAQKSLKVKGKKVTIPISDLEKGTYLVSIRTSEGNYTKKIVKE
ncbi:MAG: T9SS type A sorting domain-containing protein [Bacteroidales bacterium]|nr:T9SS type A sorting domain-containing protein [Bacteroidales bacterium]